MLLGQIWYHWKAKSLWIMDQADIILDRWAATMETAREVQETQILRTLFSLKLLS